MRRFARADERDRARSGCVLVRRLLAPWLGVPPGQIKLRAGAHGKPDLAPGAHPPLAFNLSHAGAWVLAAAAHGRAVGVDVEAHGDLPLEEFQSMAVLVFSTAEQAAWSRLGADEQPTAFYRWWARKEAYLKGTGMGIADGLEHATLGLDAAEARLISDTRAPEAPTRWHIRPLDVYPGYEGAVALALHHPLEAVRIRTLEVGPDFFLHPT